MKGVCRRHALSQVAFHAERTLSQRKDRPDCSVHCACGCTWLHYHQCHTCSRHSCGSSRAAAASDSLKRDVKAGVVSYGRPSPSGRRKRHGFADGRSAAAAWSIGAQTPVAALYTSAGMALEPIQLPSWASGYKQRLCSHGNPQMQQQRAANLHSCSLCPVPNQQQASALLLLPSVPRCMLGMPHGTLALPAPAPHKAI